MNFSEQVKPHMDEQNIRFAGLARMIGFSAAHVYDLFAGKRRWNEQAMQKTCEALGLEITLQKAVQHEEES